MDSPVNVTLQKTLTRISGLRVGSFILDVTPYMGNNTSKDTASLATNQLIDRMPVGQGQVIEIIAPEEIEWKFWNPGPTSGADCTLRIRTSALAGYTTGERVMRATLHDPQATFLWEGTSSATDAEHELATEDAQIELRFDIPASVLNKNGLHTFVLAIPQNDSAVAQGFTLHGAFLTA